VHSLHRSHNSRNVPTVFNLHHSSHNNRRKAGAEEDNLQVKQEAYADNVFISS
jgi:hypothetical protein